MCFFSLSLSASLIWGTGVDSITGRYNQISGDPGLTTADCITWCETHLFRLFWERLCSQVKLKDVPSHNEAGVLSEAWPSRCRRDQRGKRRALLLKTSDACFQSRSQKETVHFPLDCHFGGEITSKGEIIYYYIRIGVIEWCWCKK